MSKSLLKIFAPLLLSIIGLSAIFLLRGQVRFDEGLFSVEHVMTELQNLSSKELKGRALADEGQVLTEAYLKSYFNLNQLPYETKPVKLLIPQWSDSSALAYKTNEGKTIRKSIYDEFLPTADWYGSALTHEGQLVYLGHNFRSVDPGLLKDQVVLIRVNRLTFEQILELRTAGVKGILYEIGGAYGDQEPNPSEFERKSLSLRNKVGSDLFMARVSSTVANDLLAVASQNPLPGYTPKKVSADAPAYGEDRTIGVVPHISLNTALSYKIVYANNYIVTLPGKDSSQSDLWITHYDGSGRNQMSDRLYPGAIDGAGSTALLLELARVVSKQKELPSYDLNIAFLAGLSASNASANAMAAWINDKYDHSNILVMENLGTADSQGLSLIYDNYNDYNRMFISEVSSNADRFPINYGRNANPSYMDFGRYYNLKTANNSFVGITAQSSALSEATLGTTEDKFENLSEHALLNASQLLLGRLDLQLYKEKNYAFIENRHLLGVGCFLLLIHLLALPSKFYGQGLFLRKTKPIVQSRPYRLLLKGLEVVLPFLLTLVVINILINIPPDANVKVIGQTLSTNFSLYETFRTSYSGLMTFGEALITGNYQAYQGAGLFLKRSLILIFWGLGLSIALGLFKGILDARLHKRSGFLSTIGGIILYSIPDVLIAFVSLVAIVVLSKWSLTKGWLDPELMRIYLMPILSLSIVPMIYTSRVVFVAIEEEKQKEYVTFLRYKGLSENKIYLGHFIRVGFVKILESAKSIIMIIFSNLIVVEYLFNYPGIMYELMTKASEPNVIIQMTLMIGITFALIYLLCASVLRLLTPGGHS